MSGLSEEEARRLLETPRNSSLQSSGLSTLTEQEPSTARATSASSASRSMSADGVGARPVALRDDSAERPPAPAGQPDRPCRVCFGC